MCRMYVGSRPDADVKEIPFGTERSFDLQKSVPKKFDFCNKNHDTFSESKQVTVLFVILCFLHCGNVVVTRVSKVP